MNKLLVIVLLVLLLAACAAGPNAIGHSTNGEGQAAGFWLGLWHGCIAPITFIVSMFNKSVGVYESYNNGSPYNFGFAFGLIVALGGGRGAGRKAWKKQIGKTPSKRRDRNEE